MAAALPISVLIPTRNCGALMAGHLDSLAGWIDLAAEVVVVDSHSQDGTVELLRKRLPHPRIKFLTHPPGLYQSWNFGIQNVGAKYIYISTVGDSITRAGLEKLLGVADEFQSDVVLSPPGFIDAGGKPIGGHRWPIHVILDSLHVTQPLLMTTAEQFLFAVTNAWGAILGSSASNLYRADCLKARPFPTDFGTAGDGGWGVSNIFDVKIALTPVCFSTFRHHEKAYSLDEYEVGLLAPKLFRLAQTVVAAQRGHNPALPEILAEVHWSELESAIETVALEKSKLEIYREGKMPWFLNPAAWQSRITRDRAAREINRLTQRFLAKRMGRVTLA